MPARARAPATTTRARAETGVTGSALAPVPCSLLPPYGVAFPSWIASEVRGQRQLALMLTLGETLLQLSWLAAVSFMPSVTDQVVVLLLPGIGLAPSVTVDRVKSAGVQAGSVPSACGLLAPKV